VSCSTTPRSARARRAAGRLPGSSGRDGLLCDGEPGITFAGVTQNAGLAHPSTYVTAENGYRFLIIEGTCRYWVQRRAFDRLVTGTLDDAALQRIRADLQFSRFGELAGDYLGPGGGQPSHIYVLGRGGLTTPCVATADGGGCIGNGTLRRRPSWARCTPRSCRRSTA